MHTATTELYTLSLHDALPISSGSSVVAFTEQRADLVELFPCGRPRREGLQHQLERGSPEPDRRAPARGQDRKSTRLNSSHMSISYAVFCLKKKKKPTQRAELI